MRRLLVPTTLLILTACQGIPAITPTPTIESDEVVEAHLIEQVKSGLTEPSFYLCDPVSAKYADSMAAAFSTLLADPDSQRFSLDQRVEILNKAIRQVDEELSESTGRSNQTSGYIALQEGGTDQVFLVTLRVNCAIGSHQGPGSRVYIYNETGESWQVGYIDNIRETHWSGDGWIVWVDTRVVYSKPSSAIWYIRQSDGEWMNNVLIETFPFIFMQDLQVEDDFHRLTVSSRATGGLCPVPTSDPTDPIAIIYGSRQHTFELVDEDYVLVDTEIMIEEVYFTHYGERIESDWLEQHWQDLCEDWTQP